MRHQQTKGRRINYGFLSIYVDYHWFQDGKPVPRNEVDWRKEFSSNFPCKTVKAFKRKLRKWNLPKGTDVCLISIWKKHDVYCTV